MRRLSFLTLVVVLLSGCKSQNIPVPTEAQLRWQQNERAMFVHFSPATWQAREYDNGSTPLDRIIAPDLSTDQWCEVALSWGAKEIIFVAKHAGGFCWWQTDTTPYGVKNTPYKGGKGDVLREISESCKKYGLDLGVYVYPGDQQWGAGIGSGGTTEDPSKQEEYNAVFRQQLEEVLSNYGHISEVWFDGNCNIYIDDILDKYAANSVIFQSKKANIRWVGNEDGFAPYPNWYTLKSEDLRKGDATALQSDPYGDAYAPVEVDVPLLKRGGHKWFWSADCDKYLLTLDQLMSIYYKSVGRGGLLLLNATPDTTGLIPATHVDLYREFGYKIRERFDKPIAQKSGKNNATIFFEKPTVVNHAVICEDIAKGQRIQEYTIQGFDKGNWFDIVKGLSVGNKRIESFDAVTVEAIRFISNKSRATALIKSFAVYNVEDFSTDVGDEQIPKVISSWSADTYSDSWQEVSFDITRYVTAIGQYKIGFAIAAYDFSSPDPSGLEVQDIKLDMYGRDMSHEAKYDPETNTILINRSQQTLDEFETVIKMKIRSRPAKSSGDIEITRIKF